MKRKDLIKKLDENTRCPGCGELAELPVKTVQRPRSKCCPRCRTKYRFKLPALIFILYILLYTAAATGLVHLMFISVKNEHIIPGWPLLLVIPIVLLISLPLEYIYRPLISCDEEKFAYADEFEAEIQLIPEYEQFFNKDMIYPIQFASGEMQISEYCCMRMDKVSRSGYTVRCRLHTLPHGNRPNPDWYNYSFNLFFDNKLIGTGKAISKAAYGKAWPD